MNLVQETLLESLQAAAPRTLLWIAPAPMAAVDVFCQHEPECRVVSVTPEQLPGALSSLERFDYGLVHQTLERMDLDAGTVTWWEAAAHCGGGTCADCPIGYACNVPSDCVSNNCTGGICQ